MLDHLLTALAALQANKIRSVLTMLGVIIGVAAVIAMVAIGEGAKARVEQAFASMGTNLLIVMPGSVVAGGANRSVAGNRVESVPAVISRSGIGVEQGRRSLQLLVSYVGESYADALNTRAPSANGAVGLVPAYTLTDVNAAIGVTRHARLRLGINNLLDRAYFTKRPQFYPGPGVWPSDGRGVQASLELTY